MCSRIPGHRPTWPSTFSVLQPGDTILGMNLSQGGHLTHGSPASFSGKLYKVVSYGVKRDTETIDYEQLAQLAREHRPKMIIAGASAYPRTIDFQRFREIADEVGAYLTVDMAHIAGLVAAGLHPIPFPHADFVSSTTHKTLRGPRGGLILSHAKYTKMLDSQIFPGIQGARSCTSSQPKPWPSRRPCSRPFTSISSGLSRTATASPPN